MRVMIVGGGILGTAHAWAALRRGHEVFHVEREAEARGATVRNFGLVWVSGRSAAELSMAQRSRDLWAEIGGLVADVGFRDIGSITLVRTAAELSVAEEMVSRSDATARGFELLTPDDVVRKNPALRGEFIAGLYCSRDAAVESRQALPALRAYLSGSGRYRFEAGTEIRGVERTGSGVSARDDRGRTHAADAIIVCPGAAHGGLARELAGDMPVRRVRLQMMQTAPLGETLTTAIADADSFRYYPAFAGENLDRLRNTQPQNPIADTHKMQLLCVQRLHGGLTIGDTHEYTEPFGFDVTEDPYRLLSDVVEGFLGHKLPPVVRRWAGVYSQCVDPEAIVHRAQVADGIWVVTGPGGRGMTLGPAIGEQTIDLIDS
ncbi:MULTISPECIES: TIGR03364 family FAD-dependent oxidoreductase [Actinomycetes]|uniref:TIGR03364 family FAD-dependent oxidoreductase n=1 Tax=Actinomycetes TaxID=1760 RepID=UPI0004C060B0|nr:MULTISPECIES: TIGR03364 family FAD-dependent oxidoreductase [Actinomycetes]